MAGSGGGKAATAKAAGRAAGRGRDAGRRPFGVGPHAELVALQHSAGNRAVDRMLRTAEAPADDATVPAVVQAVLARGGGQALDSRTREKMEGRFGHDFARVRIHTDADAARSAEAVGARAYTVGQDVVLGRRGRGEQTLAHELAHVVQQSRGGSPPSHAPGNTLDAAADHAAGAVAAGSGPVQVAGASGPGLSLDRDERKPGLLGSVVQWGREHAPTIVKAAAAGVRTFRESSDMPIRERVTAAASESIRVVEADVPPDQRQAVQPILDVAKVVLPAPPARRTQPPVQRAPSTSRQPAPSAPGAAPPGSLEEAGLRLLAGYLPEAAPGVPPTIWSGPRLTASDDEPPIWIGSPPSEDLRQGVEAALEPTPATEPDEAEDALTEVLRERARPKPFEGVEIGSARSAGYTYEGVSSRKPIRQGPYLLVPYVRSDTGAILFYEAVNPTTNKADYVVGPNQLKDFQAKEQNYFDMGGASNPLLRAKEDMTPWERESVDAANKVWTGDVSGAVKGALGASGTAAKDPAWLFNTALSFGSLGAGGLRPASSGGALSRAFGRVVRRARGVAAAGVIGTVEAAPILGGTGAGFTSLKPSGSPAGLVTSAPVTGATAGPVVGSGAPARVRIVVRPSAEGGPVSRPISLGTTATPPMATAQAPASGARVAAASEAAPGSATTLRPSAEAGQGGVAVGPQQSVALSPQVGAGALQAAGTQQAAPATSQQAASPVVVAFDTTLRFRGGAGESGVSVYYVRNWSTLSQAERNAIVDWMRSADMESYGLARQGVTPAARAEANSVTSLGRSGLGLGPTEAAGHTPDVAAGGQSSGVIIGIPRQFNASVGGQHRRYQPGFRSSGVSLYDAETGQWLYHSMALEHEPPATQPGPPRRGLR